MPLLRRTFESEGCRGSSSSEANISSNPCRKLFSTDGSEKRNVNFHINNIYATVDGQFLFSLDMPLATQSNRFGNPEISLLFP